jgi:hypothetical protein
VTSHLNATQAVASGIHAVPDARTPWAAVQAAYRFLNNPRVSLPALAQPLLEAARQEAADCLRYLLVVHDWSPMSYHDHTSKKDRVALSHRHEPEGYELQTVLLVSDRQGLPLAPVMLSLRANDGVHCSRGEEVRPPRSPLDELAPAMDFVEQQNFSRPLVHIIDAEADSVDHYRQWSRRPGRYYLVRADDRLVVSGDEELRCSALRERLQKQQAFHATRAVQYHGCKAQQWVAEVPVRLTRAAQRNRPGRGDRQRIPGPPLDLRLVIAEVRTPTGEVLAVWYLLTNLPADIDAATVALWYYWRWSIEKYFKLLKSAGIQVETWQQTSAEAIARRLLVASMACVLVWRLARSNHPQAEPARTLLVRLSGRQMKRDRPFTEPALLSGLWVLLAMLAVLETYSLDDLKDIAALVSGTLTHPP